MLQNGVRKVLASFVALVMAVSMVSTTAVAAVADEVSAMSLGSGLLYDSVYGLVDGYALMTKYKGTGTDGNGSTWYIYQQDVVAQDGTVTLSSTWSYGDVATGTGEGAAWSGEITPTEFGASNGYLALESSQTGKTGLVTLAGQTVIEPAYDSVRYYDSYSIAVATAVDGSNSRADIYDVDGTSASLRQSIPIDSSVTYASAYIWYSVFNGRYLSVYLQWDGETYEDLYYELVDGTYQPVDMPVTYPMAYEASDGSTFIVATTNGDASDLVLWQDGDWKTVASGCTEFTVFGDLIIATVGDATKVYTYQGAEATAFDPYNSIDGYIESSGQYLCTNASGTYLVDASGVPVVTLPELASVEGHSVAYKAVGDYVYTSWSGTFTAGESVQSYVYTATGDPKATFDASIEIAKNDAVNYWVYVTPPESNGVAKTYLYSSDFQEIGTDIMYAKPAGALADGTSLYMRILDRGSDSCEVVDSYCNPVTLGGYTLSVSATDNTVEGYTSRLDASTGNSAQRGSADIYYARDASGNYGAVNSAGQVVIPFEYEAYYDAGLEDTSIIMLKKDGAWMFYDTSDDPEPTNPVYTDVDYQNPDDSYKWALDAITFVMNARLVNGYENGAFGVGDGLKREQLAVILWRYAEPEAAAAYDASKATEATGQTDVYACQYYTGAVKWAVDSGVIKGYEDKDAAGNGLGTYTRFGVGDDVTFEQLVTVLANFQVSQGRASQADVDGADVAAMAAACTDASAVSDWATPSMAWGYEAGVYGGYNNADGTKSIAPGEAVKRERVAAVLYNLNGKGMLPV